MEGTVVSRSDLYRDENDDLEPVESGGADYPQLSFAFEEVAHDSPGPDEGDNEAEPEVLEFQLFAGSGPVNVSLEEKEEKVEQGRPTSYYIYTPSQTDRERVLATAVSGNFVLEEAAALAQLAAKNPIARDINADFRPARRPCRPGKAARVKKKLRNERLEAERKAEAEQWKQRRRAFKPRGVIKRPKTGFTFK